jgi:hypothetical protein
MTEAEHYANYLRYRAAQQAKQQPFTASQQDTPLQYLPYAQYPYTPTAEEQAGPAESEGYCTVCRQPTDEAGPGRLCAWHRQEPAGRLEYLRQQIQAESISYGEIAELQGLADHIDPADTELLQWAGVEEQAGLPTAGDTIEHDGRQILVQFTEPAEAGLRILGRYIAEDGTIEELADIVTKEQQQ